MGKQKKYTSEFKLKAVEEYLSAIMDIFNNEIVPYKIGNHNTLG